MIEIHTPHGDARVRLAAGADGPAAPSRLALVLGHGAGGGIGAADLQASTEAALALGIAVALVEQPYRVAGRRTPAPARQLDTAWLAVLAALVADQLGGRRLILGGRSSGARVACRTAAVAEAVGVLCLAFPLLPPGPAREGDLSRSRQAELDAVPDHVPVLVVQGKRDPFGMPGPDGNRSVVAIPGTHALASTRAVRSAVSPWLAVMHSAYGRSSAGA